jgi:membrane-associated HD superfamily phosphohydrolase
MNSYLKNYTDALLTLHGIPLTNYEHTVGVEDLLAEMTARKTLETAMWNLCQHAEAQAEEIADLKSQGAMRKKLDEVNKAVRKQERHEAEMKQYELVDAIRELRDHIITSSETAEESAERYEKIVKYAKRTLAPYRDYDVNYVHPEDVDDEDEDSDEE